MADEVLGNVRLSFRIRENMNAFVARVDCTFTLLVTHKLSNVSTKCKSPVLIYD